jgi:gustatory receptor
MNKITSYDFCLAIRPLVYVSRALGLAPFTYVKKTLPGGKILEKLEISSAALIYSVLFAALYICLVSVSFALKCMYVYSEMTATDIVPDIFLYTSSISSSIASVLLSVTKKRNMIVRIISLIEETEGVILTSSREYYRKAKTNIIVQVLVVFIVLGLFGLYDCIIWNSIFGVTCLSFCHIYVDTFIEWIVVIQFVNMVVLLKHRFSCLNTRLSNLLGIFEFENSKKEYHLPSLETAWVSVKVMKPQLTGKEILTFNKVHDILIDTVLLVQSTYEVQIFLSLLSTFTGITIWSYYDLCSLYGYYGTEYIGLSSSGMLLSAIIWTLLHMAKLLCITVPCHSANNSMAHTSTVLRKLLLAFHTDPATMSELERFSQHIALRKFKFTVFGFLSLDLSLLVSMTGAVVTYLMILMQIKAAVDVSHTCIKNVTG